MLQPTKTSEPIPGYVVIDRLGVGGYGEVWSAQAPGGLSKAIKFVYGYFDDERASRELKALNRIKEVRHPFLLSLERFEVVDGQLLIVTELADMSLKDQFERCKDAGAAGIPRAELLVYLRDAADALDYMSENFALQHLDVKPENLLLVGGRIKVADFGLCKEIQDVAASIMSGLTPLYAPPEVFDGQPSRHSDQYSLAIVYQEMLTGTLPFPGRTTAQLAAQHLHAAPRLGSLPPADQSVIARGLAKDPQDRYPNCRTLIDALLAIDQAGHCATAPSGRRSAGMADATSETTSLKSRSAETDSDWQRSNGHVQPGTQPSATVKTQVLGSSWDTGPVAAPDTRRQAPLRAPVQEAVSLPPLDMASTASGLRPTLFLGIGGTAGRALLHVRRRLCDRFGAGAQVPSVQLLFLDTDAKNIHQVTQGQQPTALLDSEVLALPLRNPRDYTTDTRDILQWLSRRWLYNIPRSLQTEGRRPLGRLALVDHAQQVLKRLHRALAEITSPESISATEQATGVAFRTHAPRVFVISSISGGTGSGIVLDVAYAVRKILADLEISDDGVCGILTHSADRRQATRDLSIANAYACLSELHHYSGPGCYPGEPACGLPPAAGDRGTFPHAYVVRLGDELNDKDFDAAIDGLASYLCLDAFTTVGAVLDQCRESHSCEQQDAVPTLRTFGLARFGGSQASLCTDATELLCKLVVDRWRGVVDGPHNEHAATSLIDMAAQRDAPPPLSRAHDVEILAAEHCTRLEISLSKLRARFEARLQDELGGDADTVLAELLAKVCHRARGSGGQVADIAQLLQAIGNLFGPPTSCEDRNNPSALPLRTALRQDAQRLAADTGNALAEWVLDMADSQSGGVDGACRAKDWCASHLRALETQCVGELHEAQRDVQFFEQTLSELSVPAPSRTRLFASRRAEKQPVDGDDAILQLIRLRFQELAVHAICHALRLTSAPLSAAGDRLKDLRHELGRLSLQFADTFSSEDAHSETLARKVSDDVMNLVKSKLRLRLPQLAEIVDERFRQQFQQPQGGLHKLCSNSVAMQSSVPTALRSLARAEIVGALKTISVAEGLLATDTTCESQVERLQTCLDTARPKLTGCSGSQRLLVILPEADKGSLLDEAVSQLEPPATVIRDSDADLVFCYEVQELSISDVAARLVDDRVDFAQTASRLHTRTDVVWTAMTPPALSGA